MLGREREIRYLMRKFGLTRGEAEGLFNYARKHDKSGEQISPAKSMQVIKRVQKEEDLDDSAFMKAVALLGGLAGLAFADWLVRRLTHKRKKKRREREKWLV